MVNKDVYIGESPKLGSAGTPLS